MATHDLLGTIEASYHLGIGTADAATAKTGTLLATAITAVSEALAEKCGTIIYGTVTGELHDGGQPYVYLDRHPVQGVVTVVEYDGTTASTLTAESNSSKPTDAYVADLDNGRIARRNENIDTIFPAGRNNVYVTYVAGRYSSTANVGSRFKEAAAITLKNWWRTYENAIANVSEYEIPSDSFPRFAIPNAAKQLLADEWRSGSGVGD